MKFRLEEFAALPSTNSFLLAEPGSVHGRAVLAVRQTAGQGRRGRAWVSEEGNLALSLGIELKPEEKKLLPWIPVWLSIAALDACRTFTKNETLGLKWPNDIYAENKKLAGILSQAKEGIGGTRVVVGIGINLRPVEGEFIATSLQELMATVLEPKSVAAAIIGNLSDSYADTESLRQAWERRCLHMGKQVRVGDMNENQNLWRSGLSQGLNADTTLRVLMDGKQLNLSSEEVSLRF